jgi:hypothetical protein
MGSSLRRCVGTGQHRRRLRIESKINSEIRHILISNTSGKSGTRSLARADICVSGLILTSRNVMLT